MKETFDKIFNSKVIEHNISSSEIKRKKFCQISLLEIENKDKASANKQITLSGFDEIYYAIKFDSANFLHRKITDHENDYSDSLIIDNSFYKVCDYILWVKFQEHKFILVVELKSKIFDKNVINLKFRNSVAFINYLQSITKQIKDNVFDDFIPNPISILIHNKTFNKDIIKTQYGFYEKGIDSSESWRINKNFQTIIKQEMSSV